ncbi:MAG: nucleotide exchange factor GrpE [Candidatus Izemoplasmatales bacterium]
MEDIKKEPELEITEDSETVQEKTKEEKHKKKKKDSVESKLEEITEELEAFKDKYYRSLAEMENVKKRLTEDLKRERNYASYSLSDKLIDSIEIFDQALNVETEDPNFKNFLYGFKMIKDMFMQALNQEGVTLVETKLGDVFDPVSEHAVDTTHDLDTPDNTIVKIVKKGYKFKDRLLRPAMVVINIQPKEETNEENENENEGMES